MPTGRFDWATFVRNPIAHLVFAVCCRLRVGFDAVIGLDIGLDFCV